MRIFRKELIKIFNLRLLLILAGFWLIFGYLFLRWNYYPGYATSSPYDVPMYESMVEKYGITLSESEYAELLKERDNLIAKIEQAISEDEVFRSYGLTSYQEFEEIHGKFSDELTEDEKIIRQETLQFWFYNKETEQILFQIQVIDEIKSAVEIIGKAYADDKKIENVSEYLSCFTPEARERLIQYYKQDELSLLPNAAYNLINDEMLHLIILSVVSSFVLILFCQITERLRGMIPITASSRTGRKIFQHQMWASMACGGIIGLFVSMTYGIMLGMKRIYLFSECPLSQRMFHFWIDMTFGQYLILNALVLIFISAVSGLLAYFLGRLASNYIAGIAFSIPTAVLYCIGTAHFIKFMLRIDVNAEYFYCKSLNTSLLWTFGGLTLIALLIEIMVYFLLKRDKERDIL